MGLGWEGAWSDWVVLCCAALSSIDQSFKEAESAELANLDNATTHFVPMVNGGNALARVKGERTWLTGRRSPMTSTTVQTGSKALDVQLQDMDTGDDAADADAGEDFDFDDIDAEDAEDDDDAEDDEYVQGSLGPWGRGTRGEAG